MPLQRSSSDAVVTSRVEGRPSVLPTAELTVVIPPRPALAGGPSQRGPALLVGRGFYTPDMVRPQPAEAGSTPEGFALEGGTLGRANLPALADLESLSLLPLKLGKNRSSSVKSRLTSRPSVGSITRLELSDRKDQAAESQQRASATPVKATRRLDFQSSLDFESHGPPQLDRGWHTPDLQPVLGGHGLDRLSLEATSNQPGADAGFVPLIQPVGNQDQDAASSGDERGRITLAGPPIVEETAADFAAAEPVKTEKTVASGMRRSNASMAALSSLLTGDAEDGGKDVRLDRQLSQQSLQSSGPSDDHGTCTPSSSNGELSLGSDDDSPQKIKTNMTRRTSSGTDIHYVSFWEGHGGGHLIREDSYQFAGSRRPNRAAARTSEGPLLRFMQHVRHKHDRRQRNAAGKNTHGGGGNGSHNVGARAGGTAVGAPVHEATFATLPDSCILGVINMLEDVKAVARCGSVCRKLNRLQSVASASYLRLSIGAASGRHSNPDSGQKRQQTCSEVVQGCLRHGVTRVDFCEATQMGARLIAKLGDSLVKCQQLLAQTPPVVQLAQRLQHLVLANNTSLTSLQGLQAAAELRQLVLRGCTKLASIDAVAPLAKLQTLDLTWCEKITDLSPLREGHAALIDVALTGCELLKTASLEPLMTGCPRLQFMRLGGLDYVGSLDLSARPGTGSSSCWPDLQRLYLNGTKFLGSLGPLGNKLVLADLSFCRLLVDTSWLEGCNKLEHLNLAHCIAIKSLDGCSECPNLKSIGLWGCTQIKSVDPLVKCQQLQVVDCTAMVRILLSTLKHLCA